MMNKIFRKNHEEFVQATPTIFISLSTRGILKGAPENLGLKQTDKVATEEANELVSALGLDEFEFRLDEAFQDKVIELRSQGKLEEALELVARKNFNAVMLCARYQGAKKQYALGLMDFSEWSRTQAQVGYALMSLVKSASYHLLPKTNHTLAPVKKLHKLVIKEVEALYKELATLDYYVGLHQFDAELPESNLYGQLFVSCRSKEAVEVLNRVAKPFSASLVEFSETKETQFLEENHTCVSALEYYLSCRAANVDYVISCINTKTKIKGKNL